MKIFKFGGASIKDADGINNLVKVLETTGEKNLVVVVSAMGKMTNALEKVVTAHLQQDDRLKNQLSSIENYHFDILKKLFPNQEHPIYKAVSGLFDQLKAFLASSKSKNHAFVYDQIVSYGELVSTTIVSTFLSEKNISNTWLDVRGCIKTDSNYRDAKVDWDVTQKRITDKVSPMGITITQGFLGAEHENNFTTTLGREGSDYTAAIFAYCLNAISVTIWKDVPGVLNADPRYFSKTQLLNKISYREAIELAFYGASVIHPKTLQPLQRKEIPLYVKSFYSPHDAGTCVGKGVALDPKTSCFILKDNLVLISLSSLDFSFMMEDNIGDVFKWLHQYKMKVELIQNSAISFSVCVDNKFNTLDALLVKLREKFRVKWNEGVTLYTVRHSAVSEIKALTENRKVLLKQESRGTVQIVVEN
ncbi:aspartate kinase [Marixanthomonas spongiae]|uniref:Aspartokinase n=1 Tax=Marixanthomonas spongiae TaxID=2174845 RepID=A0A2U0I2L1_9FLAO|nr:aspartate kinase [Marixanthomonas spongiae]PVW15339.1 aspartate kinase [Marixanthomonas spongiae]